MPRNKRPQEREAKRGEIVAAARALFVERGYDATPIGAIAKAAGVTPNTIYWYFSDKDDVLIAVLDELVVDSWRAYRALGARSDVDLLLWVVAQFAELRLLISSIHARIEVSPSLDAWHDRFHAASEGVLVRMLVARGEPEESASTAVKILVFVIEGLLTHATPPAEQRAVLEALIAARPAAAPASS